MDILKAKRKAHRASFTKCCTSIEESLKKTEVLNAERSALLKQLLDKYTRLEGIQEEISNTMLSEETSQNEYEDDYEKAEVYRDRFFQLSAALESAQQKTDSVIENIEKRKFKLPKLELRKFSGEPKDYLSFWSQFEKIHDDPDIVDDDKFQYLLQCVVPESKAARLVESFPPTKDNYSKVITQLKERFGREDLLVQIYVRDLLSIVMRNASGKIKCDLTELYDLLESKLMALESLGRTQEKFADFLEPLIESCLPESVLRAWERSRSSEESSPQNSVRSLEKLMTFLRTEVQSEEMIKLARTGLGAPRTNSPKTSMDTLWSTATAAALVNMNPEQGRRNFDCIFCSKKHCSSECFAARKMSLEERRNILVQKRACFRCLRLGHLLRNCKIKIKCMQCDKGHYILMCPAREAVVSNDTDKNAIASNALSNQCKFSGTVYLQTLVLRLISKDKELHVRGILDSGSQRSYISQKVIDTLTLRPKSKQTIVHGLFGGRETKPRLHSVFDIEVRNLNDTFGCFFEVLSENKICGFVPRVNDLATLQELKQKNILVHDLEIKDHEIDLLLGADIMGNILTGNSIKLNSGVTVMETKFGNTVMGKAYNICDQHKVITAPALRENNMCNNEIMSLNCSNVSVSELWDLDAIGITDPCENSKKKIEYSQAIEQFKENLKILPDGRYELQLPFRNETVLSCNKTLTFKRHQRMCQRAVEDNYLNDYIAVFRDWENLNIIEKVPESEINNVGWYLPHRPVIKPSSQTMKLRPVFDASAREVNQPSLNDCLIKGPNLIELIPDIIDRFRLFPIGLSADIEKAFLQLSIIPEHRDCLRFFFPSSTESLIYRHCRVVFGVSSSPFLLAASINHLLDNSPAEFDDVTTKLINSFYVDNCVTGVFSIGEQEYFIRRATEVMARRCFNLRGWESNVPSQYTSKSSGMTSLLGILWDLDMDSLKCSFSRPISDTLTKRNVLATVQRFFDPIGMLSPTTLLPKCMLQQTWTMKLKWDDPLPFDLQRSFLKWLGELSYLEEISIPRYVEISENSELHVFTDACRNSYGACIYIRTVTSVGVKVQMIRARSRVAPLKSITIPRLELMACCIGARLVYSVCAAIDLPNLKIVAWSDSMVALWWIRNRGDWSVFVANRVKEINQLVPSQNWRHVPGSLNPADLLSRGCFPHQLFESRWWEGPCWLREPHDNWPVDQLHLETPEVEMEKRKVKLCNLNLFEEETPWYANKFSKFQSIIRLVSWILRFLNNASKKSELRQIGELSLHEIERAEKVLIRMVQALYLPSVDSIHLMNVFTDEEGIIRVKTRITERVDEPEFISPILLPDKCIFTQRLIEHYHRQNCHAGTQMLLGILRERYWIIRGRKTVRSVLKGCMRCQRYKSKSFISDPVTLPADRVSDAAVFEVVGVDMAGPMFVKGGDKVWVALYTCAIYRAIHLELVSSLSTDAFLLSFRRFVSRRGRPRIIYSDNGSNFRCAQKELAAIDWTAVASQANSRHIKWKFNPPTAAWWGGWWERLVRVVKELLRRTLGKAVLSFEELQTVLCECESVINSRPLTYLSENSEDLIPISPAMFLLENHHAEVPDVDIRDSKHLQRRIRYRYKLLRDLRSRFRREYLGLLIQKRSQKGPSSELRLGEIVLIGDDVKKRINWPLAKVIQLIPGKDGKCRTVKLKTQSGTLLRPIQRVFPLEVQQEYTQLGPLHSNSLDDSLPSFSSDVLPDNDSSPTSTSDLMFQKVSKSGRVIKVPERLDLFNQALHVFESKDSKRGSMLEPGNGSPEFEKKKKASSLLIGRR